MGNLYKVIIVLIVSVRKKKKRNDGRWIYAKASFVFDPFFFLVALCDMGDIHWFGQNFWGEITIQVHDKVDNMPKELGGWINGTR